MTEGTVPGSSGEDGSAQIAEGSEGAARSADTQIDPNDYLARIRADPEFAAQEVQKHQSAAGTALGRLKKAEHAIRAAEVVGKGDVESGGQSIAEVAGIYTQIFSDPQMSQLVTQWLQTGQIPQTQTEDGDSYEDPNEKALRELRTDLDQVKVRAAKSEVRAAKSEMMNQIETFFQKDKIGQVLSPEERGEVLDALVRNVDQWARTPQGRQQLESLNSATIELVTLRHLKDTGKLFEVSERVARQKAEQRQDSATEGPSGISTTGAGLTEHYTAKPGTKDFTLEVVREAKRKFA